MSIIKVGDIVNRVAPHPPTLNVVDINSFIQMPLAPRENILSPWLPTQGLAMIYAPRGVGKTHVALGIAYAVVTNTPFLRWQPTKARAVLYIDGEMPAVSMQDRLLSLINTYKQPITAPFLLITPDLQKTVMPDLATHLGRMMLEPYLENIELIIIDNISTLCRNTRENEADSWIPVQEWALKMRSMGKSVLFIHHAGKGGNQRGTSKREDILDTVIVLKRPYNYKPQNGAAFEIHFEKARGFVGDATEPFEAKLVTKPDGFQEWLTSPIEDTVYDQIIGLTKQGYKQNQIAEQLDIHKSNVSRHLKRAHQEGKIE